MQSLLRPIELVVLQGTSFCNLNCTYCDLSVESRRTRRVMPFDLIDKSFNEIFSSGLCAEQVDIIWHSGEPLTQKPDYYEEAIQRILKGKAEHPQCNTRLHFDIQTNGVLIDREWQDFFVRHRHHLSVGISCDGPEAMHDQFRVNWSNRSTHFKTVDGMRKLAEADIKFKVIAVVTDAAMADPEAFFDFFWSWRNHLRGFHFNILASGDASDDPALRYASEDRERYARFYRKLLDIARARRAAENGFAIQNFSQALARILNPRLPGHALHAEESSAPIKSLTIDADGNVTTFYAGLVVDAFPNQYGDGKGFSLGNIRETSLSALLTSTKLQRMMDDFAVSRAACASACPYFSVCSGGFELTKLSRFGRFDAAETPECEIHVKAMTDALIEDISEDRSRAPDPLVHREAASAGENR